MALAAALHLKYKKFFEEVLVSRREVGVEGDDHGFLPGNEQEKIKPYMMPFIDNLKTLSRAQGGNDKKLEKLKGEDSFPFTTFSTIYLRGRSIQDSFIIIDEAQNLSPHQIKTIITRAGEGTKIILLGDISQVDITHKYLRKNMNGLTYVMKNLVGEVLYAHVKLEDVVRSELAMLGTKLP
jgi:PhoH-like ATPase